MLTAASASYCASPEYRSKLEAQGHSTTETFEYAGRTITHDDVAAATEESYARHRGQYLQRCGAKDRVNRKIQRQFRDAVQEDVRTQFGISKPSIWTAGFAIVLGILGGPMGLVIAVVTCLFEYYLSKDLDKLP